jgi:hypothetical protein
VTYPEARIVPERWFDGNTTHRQRHAAAPPATITSTANNTKIRHLAASPNDPGSQH